MHAATNTASKSDERVVPWNKGKLIGQKPPLKLKEIWAIDGRLRSVMDMTRRIANLLYSRRQRLAFFRDHAVQHLRGFRRAHIRRLMDVFGWIKVI